MNKKEACNSGLQRSSKLSPANNEDSKSEASGDKPFGCDFCGNEFFMRSDLNSHILQHADKRPFQCHVCSRSYKLKGMLKSHMLTHKGKKPYICAICDEGKFDDFEHLKKHNSLHFKEQGVLCYYCGKMYARRTIFNRHIRSHNMQDSCFCGYSCKYCEKHFKREKDLRRHMFSVHTSERSFKCEEELCGASFNRKDNLGRHKRKLHGNKY